MRIDFSQKRNTHTYSEIFICYCEFFKEVKFMEDTNLNKVMFTTYKDVVTVKQLAEMLGIGITLAYRLVKQKTIQSIKVGREYKIPKHCVINYLEKKSV